MLFYGWSYKALLRELQCVLLIFEPEKNTSPNLFSRTVRKHRKSDLSFFQSFCLHTDAETDVSDRTISVAEVIKHHGRLNRRLFYVVHATADPAGYSTCK